MPYEDDDLESQQSYSDEEEREAEEFNNFEEEEGEGEGEEFNDEDKLPEHACAYCGVSEEAAVAQCVKTKRWFCNGTGMKSSGSHLVQHLVKKKLSGIKLHPENEFAKASLLCYHCGSANLFLLGYIVNKDETMVMMLCRGECQYTQKVDQNEWNQENWNPLIQNRAVVPWLLSEPEEELDRVHQVSDNDIHKIEEAWKKDPTLTMQHILESDQAVYTKQVAKTPSIFPNKIAYGQIFKPLVEKEAEYSKKIAEAQSQPNVNVEFRQGGRTAEFAYPKDAKIELGDDLNIKLIVNRKAIWRSNGYVYDMRQDGTIVLVLKKMFNISSSDYPQNSFTVRIVWRSTSFDRMKNALKRFSSVRCMSDGLLKLLLGIHIDNNKSYLHGTTSFKSIGQKELNNTKLNSTQREAVYEAVKNTLTLIQGPPGTGKTVTSTEIICQFVKQYPTSKMLICAPSNVAVNQLTEKLIQYPEINVVRVYARSKLEKLDEMNPLFHHTLHYKTTKLMAGNARAEAALRDYELEPDNDKFYEKYKRYFKEYAKKVLDKTHVVCCTCVGAGDQRLNGIKFERVLIDECTQATEPEAIIPVVKHAKQLVLVGDHRQLGPVVMNKEAAINGLKRSLFGRLVSLGYTPHMLKEQYRMHPSLSSFSSNTFYHGNLMNGRRAIEKPPISFKWPNKDVPMIFYNCSRGFEEYSSSTTSYLNRVEAELVEEVVTLFFNLGAKPANIGIITPYQGQRSFLATYLPRFGEAKYRAYYQSIELASVDAFQGREKDFIILSCVRSNQVGDIGFLKDPCRLNVALTRAKHGLVIIGNLKLLEQKPLWNQLLQHYSKQHCIINQIAKSNRPQILYAHKIRPMQFDEENETNRELGTNFKPGRRMTES